MDQSLLVALWLLLFWWWSSPTATIWGLHVLFGTARFQKSRVTKINEWKLPNVQEHLMFCYYWQLWAKINVTTVRNQHRITGQFRMKGTSGCLQTSLLLASLSSLISEQVAWGSVWSALKNFRGWSFHHLSGQHIRILCCLSQCHISKLIEVLNLYNERITFRQTCPEGTSKPSVAQKPHSHYLPSPIQKGLVGNCENCTILMSKK